MCVCFHGGYPPNQRFSKLSKLELLYFHFGTTLGREIKGYNVFPNRCLDTLQEIYLIQSNY